MKYIATIIFAVSLLLAMPVMATEQNSGFGDFFANQTHNALGGEDQTTEQFDAVAADQITAEDAAQIAPAAGGENQDSETTATTAKSAGSADTDNGIYTAAPIPENAFDGSWQRNSNEFVFGP